MERTFGRYKIVGELGRGAMGAVYRAVDPLIEREVAIKTLLPDLPPEMVAEVRERFIREARSAGRLNHPNIVTVYDVGEQDGVAYIAMELLEGSSLQQLMRGGRLPFPTIADICAQVAEALDHAAQRFQIVHRDVKPANVMVAPSGRCKLTDFGVAYVPTSTMTQTGASLGSPRYMSPEQALGQPVDGRSDIFSLGVVLYEMLAGKNPFQRPTDTSPLPIMHRIAAEPHPPVRMEDKSIPAAFDVILARALAKKPEQRYQKAGEMAQALRAAVQQPATASAYEKTQKVDAPAEHEKTMVLKPAARPAAAEDLLGDLDAFSKTFEEEQAKLKAAEEAERKAREQKEKAWREQIERERAAAEKARQEAEFAAAKAAQKRSSALEALRAQAATLPPKVDEETQRGSDMVALDKGMRDTFRYLSEVSAEIRNVGPTSNGAYDFPIIGRIPAVTLGAPWVDSRPKRIIDRDYLAWIAFRYNVAPKPPLAIRLQRDDIPRFTAVLTELKADYDVNVEAKNDFGQPLRAVLTVKGRLPCHMEINADYDKMMVTIDMVNIRRAGRTQARVPAAQMEDFGDELARYILGVDSEFAKRIG